MTTGFLGRGRGLGSRLWLALGARYASASASASASAPAPASAFASTPLMGSGTRLGAGARYPAPRPSWCRQQRRRFVRGVRGFYRVGGAVAGKDLAFAHADTNSHIRYMWKNGKWDGGELIESPYIKLHINSNVLHYGQALFEGLKAFHGQDDLVRVLNCQANAQRMNRGCHRLRMPAVPEQMFREAIDRVIVDNADHIPPYGKQQTLYLRPNIFGHGPQIGLAPAPEYCFIVSVHPVGNYFKHGPKPAKAKVVMDFDRAASHGTGDIKAAGNYAADMLPSHMHHAEGFSLGLYLDATKQYIEEFGTSNFVGIDENGAYVTPESDSILASITNQMLQRLAESRGLDVQHRQMHVSELQTLRSCGGCGTAVVFQPIKSITCGDKIYEYADEEHEVLLSLSKDLIKIGFGEKEDKFGWTHIVPLP